MLTIDVKFGTGTDH